MDSSSKIFPLCCFQWNRQLMKLFLFLLIAINISSASSLDTTSATSSKQNDIRTKNKAYNLLTPNCPNGKEPKSKAIPWSEFLTIMNNNNANNNKNVFFEHVVIPCDTVVIIPAGAHLTFNQGIAIRGKLLFEDEGAPIIIEATYILVLGWMKIGSSQQYQQSKVTFILKDHPNKAGLKINGGKKSNYDFGRKCFVVLGGKVSFYGADENKQIYAPMYQSALTGETKIVVLGDVKSQWNIGDTIGIASSFFRGDLTSRAEIAEMRLMMKETAVTEITLKKPLEQFHMVRSVARSDNPDTVIYLRPEVVLLNRNIVIRGSYPEEENTIEMTSKKTFLGGHFIMTHTAYSQVVQGVEFVHMGQAGYSGRYPIHFHFGGYVSSKSLISRNSIHDSFQRCVVIHATHNLKIYENIAFNTYGHCFMTEDGIETGNQFIGNIAINVQKALKNIKAIYGDPPTDKEASGFWISGPSNHIVDNIVAGAFNTGYWYESFSQIGGDSAVAKLPGYDVLDLKKENFGVFRGNVAHSVNIGLNPGHGRSPQEYMLFENFFAWTVNRGFHSGAGTKLGLIGATIVDFYSCGVSAGHSDGLILQNSVIIGEIDVPKHCEKRQVAGLKLSPAPIPIGKPASAFIFENLHFQHISASTNCQKSNVGIEIAMSKNQKWGVNSIASSVTFDENTVDSHWVMHNYDNVQEIGIVTMRIEGDGAGLLQPQGSIVSIGWENWEDVTAGCHNMDALSEGLNSVYCPHTCWRQVNIEFEEIGLVGSAIEVYSYSTG